MGTEVAVKEMRPRRSPRHIALECPVDNGHLELMRGECDLLASLRFPNIVTMYGGDWSTDRPHLVLEYCAGGSLAGAIAGPALPRRSQLCVLRDVAGGLTYLHSLEPQAGARAELLGKEWQLFARSQHSWPARACAGGPLRPETGQRALDRSWCG